MFKRQPLRVLAQSVARSSCSLLLMQELTIPLLLMADLFVILRLGVQIILESPRFSPLRQLQFPCTSIIFSQLSLSSSIVHSAPHAINWVHKLAGFEDVNPCDTFLVKSIAKASNRIPRGPVKKAEPMTPEIIG